MKTGRDLPAVISELLRQSEHKRDFLTPANQLSFDCNGSRPQLGLTLAEGDEQFPLLNSGHQQLAERLEIPKAYYDRMLEEAPELLQENVSTWLERSEKQFLIRTLDNQTRAVLSDRYRILDNDDLANVALPVLTENGFEIISSEITARKFYLKASTRRVQAEVTTGDVVQAGIVISNSEIGHGTLKIEPMLYFLVCSNGTVIPEAAMRRQHVGRNIGDLEAAERYYQQETRRADDTAFWLKVRDILQAAIEVPAFNAYLNRLRDSTKELIKADPFKVVELTAKRYRLNEQEKHSVLKNFLTGHHNRPELSRYGLMQALTRASQEVEDYDRASELEQLGGHILELPARLWSSLAAAEGV